MLGVRKVVLIMCHEFNYCTWYFTWNKLYTTQFLIINRGSKDLQCSLFLKCTFNSPDICQLHFWFFTFDVILWGFDPILHEMKMLTQVKWKYQLVFLHNEHSTENIFILTKIFNISYCKPVHICESYTFRMYQTHNDKPVQNIQLSFP